MKHKKIIKTIYNHIKDIEGLSISDYQNMINDPSQCLFDNKDFDFNIDLETFNDLARFAILKKMQRDLQIKWCKKQIDNYQLTQEYQDQFVISKKNKEFITISCEFLKKVCFSSCSVLSEATAPDLRIYELKNGNYIYHKKIK